MYKMNDYDYYEAVLGGYEERELLYKMIELFEDMEIVDIYDDEDIDEDGYKIRDIWVARIRMDRKKYNGLSEVLIRGFEMELLEKED